MTTAATSNSVKRAFGLIDLIEAAEPRGATLADVSAAVPMAKSSVLRYLTTLVDVGVLRRDGQGNFRLGLRLVELAGGLLDNDDPRNVAGPPLHDLLGAGRGTGHP